MYAKLQKLLVANYPYSGNVSISKEIGNASYCRLADCQLRRKEGKRMNDKEIRKKIAGIETESWIDGKKEIE